MTVPGRADPDQPGRLPTAQRAADQATTDQATTDQATTDQATTDQATTDAATGRSLPSPSPPGRPRSRDGSRLVVGVGLSRRRRRVADAPSAPGSPRRARLTGLPGRHLGLRARITAMFGLGALLLSVVMGVGTYLAARAFTLRQRSTAAVHQTFVDAQYLQRADLASPVTVLSTLDTSGSRGVLEYQRQWFAASVAVGRRNVPADLQHVVASGNAAQQYIVLDGSPALLVGVPILSRQAEYYEFVSFDGVARSLQILALALAGAGAVTTVAGAVVGRWASGRALGPLAAVSHAAEVIASGRLDTRLQAADDADLRPLAGSFNHMADALEERIEREARFTSDVSHELRSPLTTLSTSLGVLEAHGGTLSDRGRTALGLLGTEVRHFQRMVTDLLEISRVDTGAAVLAAEEVEVAELVDHLASSAATGVPLAIDPAVAHLRLSVDKRRIERVVANLVANAAKYAGGATLLSAEPARAVSSGDDGGLPTDNAPAGRWVHLVVSDAGPGIVPGERQRIFERFYRGSASGKRGDTEGTGLGLALVTEHVRLHGGRVWAEPGTDGRGSRFVVALPVPPTDASPGPPTPAPRPARPT